MPISSTYLFSLQFQISFTSEQNSKGWSASKRPSGPKYNQKSFTKVSHSPTSSGESVREQTLSMRRFSWIFWYFSVASKLKRPETVSVQGLQSASTSDWGWNELWFDVVYHTCELAMKKY